MCVVLCGVGVCVLCGVGVCVGVVCCEMRCRGVCCEV